MPPGFFGGERSHSLLILLSPIPTMFIITSVVLEVKINR